MTPPSHCRNGHELKLFENLYIYVVNDNRPTSNARERWKCRACERARQHQRVLDGKRKYK